MLGSSLWFRQYFSVLFVAEVKPSDLLSLWSDSSALWRVLFVNRKIALG